MKKCFKPLTASLLVLGMITLPGYAFANNNADINARTQALEKQLADMQAQLTALKSQLNAEKAASSSAKQKKNRKTHAQNTMPEARATTTTNAPSSEIPESGEPSSGNGPSTLPSTGVSYLPVDFDVPGQSFVSTGPYIGVPLEYSGSNLIINTPNINQDVALLKVRKNINERLVALGRSADTDRAHLLLSGTLEGQAIYKNFSNQSNTSDIDLTNAVLDAYILGPSTWTSGLMSLSYENDIGSNTGAVATNNRSGNSRVFISQAFIILGDFAKSPWYASFGQMYVPFGTYATSMVSSPLTKSLGRTKARALNIGYQQQAADAFYAAAFIFKGDSHASSTDRVNNGGLNIGYRFKTRGFNGDIGAGVIGNIADSGGMQNTGNNAPLFSGFGGINGTGNEQLVHRVPAYNIHALVSVGPHVDLLGEYIIASTRFNPADMTYQSQGARPQALNAEASYSFTVFTKPSSVAVGYGMTQQALAIGLPAKRYSMVFNTSWWRNTIESLEFRHDINYSLSNVSTGSNVPAPSASNKWDNIVTAQFDLYF